MVQGRLLDGQLLRGVLRGHVLGRERPPGGFLPGGGLLPGSFPRGSPFRNRELRAELLDLGFGDGELAPEHQRVPARGALGRHGTPGRHPLGGRPLGGRALGRRVPGDRTPTRRTASRRTLGRGFPRRSPLGHGLRVLFRSGAAELSLLPTGGLAAVSGGPLVEISAQRGLTSACS